MIHEHSVDEYIAVDHFLTLDDSEADEAAVRRAVEWIEASPENRERYERVRRFSSACDLLTQPAARARPTRRPVPKLVVNWVLTLTAVATAVVGGLTYLPRLHPATPEISTYVSQVGEIRRVGLADGSVITLGGGTRLTVAMGKTRDVRLANGRAFFEVAKDADRPFVVSSATGSVTALGTAFDVDDTRWGVQVTLARGAVLVKNGGNGTSLRLVPGQQVIYKRDGQIGPARYVDLDRELAWRTGELYFMRRPLTDVVAELNRYATKPIILTDASAGDVEVTGVVKIDGIADWLRGVTRVTEVEMHENADRITLRIRAGAPGMIANRSGSDSY